MKNENMLCELECFKNISKETLDILWKEGNVRNYRKHDIVIQAGQVSQYLFIQLTGKSIIYNISHLGKRRIFFVFGPSNLLNDDIFEEHDSTVSCEMIETGKIFVISKIRFLRIMKTDFELTKSMIQMQDKKIWRLGHQLKNSVGSLYTERKVASKLYKLSRDFGKQTEDGVEINFNVSITFLADMIGAPRETVSKACKNLMTRGYISQEKKRFTILDVNGIREFYKGNQ